MLGIFGGTFDPVHYGHLRTALDVQEALELDRVYFVPLKEAVHRDQPETAAELRCSMVQAAIGDQPGFMLDDRELRRMERSYSLYTVEAFRRQFPDSRICFLMGMDAFRGFLDWHKPGEILQLAHIVVMHRPETESLDEELKQLVQQLQVEDAGELRSHEAGKILFQPVTQLDISSTDIRRRRREGKSIRYLVPESVRNIISYHRLYRES